MIQNEGIADLIDKSEGYRKYFTESGELPEIIEVWDSLYNQANTDLEIFHNLILSYSRNEISEKETVDDILKIVKFNGHPIGFFMANQIVNAGYKSNMLNTFYNPNEFYKLYNKAAKQLQTFQLSNKFMDNLNALTEEYYR